MTDQKRNPITNSWCQDSFALRVFRISSHWELTQCNDSMFDSTISSICSTARLGAFVYVIYFGKTVHTSDPVVYSSPPSIITAQRFFSHHWMYWSAAAHRLVWLCCQTSVCGSLPMNYNEGPSFEFASWKMKDGLSAVCIAGYASPHALASSSWADGSTLYRVKMKLLSLPTPWPEAKKNQFSMCYPKGAHSITHRWLQLPTFWAFWIKFQIFNVLPQGGSFDYPPLAAITHFLGILD